MAVWMFRTAGGYSAGTIDRGESGIDRPIDTTGSAECRTFGRARSGVAALPSTEPSATS